MVTFNFHTCNNGGYDVDVFDNGTVITDSLFRLYLDHESHEIIVAFWNNHRSISDDTIVKQLKKQLQYHDYKIIVRNMYDSNIRTIRKDVGGFDATKSMLNFNRYI